MSIRWKTPTTEDNKYIRQLVEAHSLMLAECLEAGICERVHSPGDYLHEKVKALDVEFPGITLGYIGNCESWGDDRSWAVYLPHPGRAGTAFDRWSIGDTANLERALAKWAEIEDFVRRQYSNPERLRQQGGR